VLNECLVDRGASPAMVTLQVSADRHHITTVQVRPPAHSHHICTDTWSLHGQPARPPPPLLYERGLLRLQSSVADPSGQLRVSISLTRFL
jgi:hypothetical protein